MAISNDNSSDSLIGKYVDACNTAKVPLSNFQISILEKTIYEIFGITQLPRLSPNVFKPMDTLHITGRLENILREYRRKNLELTDDIPLSEAEAWSLYYLTANEIDKTTFKTLKKEHNLPSNYGFTAYKYLHEYFVRKGYISVKTKFQMPRN